MTLDLILNKKAPRFLLKLNSTGKIRTINMLYEGLLGNKNGTKIKDPKLRQEAYLDYCNHIAKGKSKDSWVFNHPEATCTWETMEKYIKDETEFDPIHKKVAQAKSFDHWEEILYAVARGDNEKGNVAALQMIFRSKFGWDKRDNHALIDNVEINLSYDKLMTQLSDFQTVNKQLINSTGYLTNEMDQSRANGSSHRGTEETETAHREDIEENV